MGVSVGLCWAAVGHWKIYGPAWPCSRNVWPVKSCSWRHLVLLTLSWSIMTCQPSTNRDVFLFASSCYPLAKPSGETLKLLAVSVPSTKEQNSQETNSSFPADDSPSALGPFFRFDFDNPLRRKRDGDDGPVAPNVWKTLGWNMMKHVETYTSPGFSGFWVHQSMMSWLSQKNTVSWLDLVGIVTTCCECHDLLSYSQLLGHRNGEIDMVPVIFPSFSPPFVAWWCHPPEALGKGQARDSCCWERDFKGRYLRNSVGDSMGYGYSVIWWDAITILYNYYKLYIYIYIYN